MKPKILVVDDLSAELEAITQVFAPENYHVLQAKNGDEALTLIEQEKPDLVVLDVIMPKINGFEVIREIRGNPKTEKLPVVFCSQKDTDIDKTWGMDLGADAYVAKPFDPQQLREIVNRLLMA
ncbi:response regulator [Spirulina subsalsa FACHB-351]|uniref:Response regulator n=1 Tax=Spirulina subsalsa FACHB-351 TaxID=234711 RepID=A0ABT3L9K3_9CYAN|nr:response regulator [Spirulina subsalsa]MCW6038175.1 response regulator [Spirulina subsalsa FACHB-351]